MPWRTRKRNSSSPETLVYYSGRTISDGSYLNSGLSSITVMAKALVNFYEVDERQNPYN